MAKVSIYKTDEIAAFQKLITDYFTTPGKTQLVYDDSVTPHTDEITPFTDAIAALATAISPIRQYPGSAK